jgi:hypothetical protein
MRSLNILEHFLLLKLLAFNHVKCVFFMSISVLPYFISPLTSNCKVRIPYYYINAHQIPRTFISHFDQNLNPPVLHGTWFIRIDCWKMLYGNPQKIKFSCEWNIWNIFLLFFFFIFKWAPFNCCIHSKLAINLISKQFKILKNLSNIFNARFIVNKTFTVLILKPFVLRCCYSTQNILVHNKMLIK